MLEIILYSIAIIFLIVLVEIAAMGLLMVDENHDFTTGEYLKERRNSLKWRLFNRLFDDEESKP